MADRERPAGPGVAKAFLGNVLFEITDGVRVVSLADDEGAAVSTIASYRGRERHLCHDDVIRLMAISAEQDIAHLRDGVIKIAAGMKLLLEGKGDWVEVKPS